MPLRLSALLLTLALGAPVANGQTDSRPADSMFIEEAVRADLTDLYETLREAHYDLYVYADSVAYEARYREALAAIDGPMTRLDVVRLFMPFVAFGDIGHARIDFPIADYVPYVTGGGTLLPFDVRTEGGRTLVAHSYTDAVRPGDELIALDGRPAAEWVGRLGRYVSAERDYKLEMLLPRLLWLDGGRADSFSRVG